ncbi:antibiotic biosynthesis monooxygenase family protein [Sphingobium fluviale]|uniref:Antibiotic biosynthesis monooxygenase n=1 Tax=Sphingobium fluviale TaxID=2506423 RepID=A0A4Q1KGJ6_9SPHN|nr:antibiotic biosynthesis monooxygenase family protein [Sphingobium fluviale]RXR28435.1 antibiotic biosynthesis monooxygenase [Sphingobium fluviale]
MITEVVEIPLKAGMVEQFVAGVERSRSLFEESPGFIAFEVHRVIEHPSTVMLLIQWESVAHHMDMFRNSPQYTAWRANVGEYFAEAPRLLHTQTLVSY